MGSSVEGILTICLNGSTPMNKMAAIPMYGKKTTTTKKKKKKKKQQKKNLKNLLQYQESFGHQGLNVCLVRSDYDPMGEVNYIEFIWDTEVNPLLTI